MTQAYVLIVGTGRSGTTAVANVLSCHPDLLYVDEPNFIDALYLPFARGVLETHDLFAGRSNEGWRGAMKLCRSLSEMYPSIFGDTGASPIRPYMQGELTSVVEGVRPRSVAERPEMIRNSLHRIFAWTCAASEKRHWLVKQPRLVLCCDELVKYWEDLRIIHVARRLEYVLRSRLTRGYQTSLTEALTVCIERLEAAARLDRYIDPGRIMHVRIEEIVEDPVNWIGRICSFAKLDPCKPVQAAGQISKDALYALGPIDSFFSSDEKSRVEAARHKVNNLFKRPLA